MKRIHVIGLATMAALLVTAVGASVAFGFSEWLTTGGANPKGIKITGKGGTAFFEGTGKDRIECEKSESSGEFKSVLQASLLVKYKGKCEISGKLHGKCNEPIETELLIAEPGTIAAAGSGRGALFLPAEGTVMAEPVCAGVTITVQGGLVCETKPIGELSLSSEVNCRETSAGVQQFNEIEVDGVKEKTN